MRFGENPDIWLHYTVSSAVQDYPRKYCKPSLLANISGSSYCICLTEKWCLQPSTELVSVLALVGCGFGVGWGFGGMPLTFLGLWADYVTPFVSTGPKSNANKSGACGICDGGICV
ncbi:hypothetical protein O6P43_016008 [Quillaja saponaria]|uniref:Uncharacterized protein n=1 Tax=Quillaja saponaria TaxID=32244 RepID=A0AAD7PSG7_QUISA|nr:hypothetical protein O6P43_016008 [Quillaja saponaria]